MYKRRVASFDSATISHGWIFHRIGPTGQLGVSLIETLTGIGVLALLVGLAVPAVQSGHEKRRLEGIAAELATDIHFARSEAIARNRGIRISFGTDTGGTCYVLHTGDPGACNCVSDGTGQCLDAGDLMIKSVGFPSHSGVHLSANVATMGFNPASGTTTPGGSINITTSNGNTIRHVINIMGRPRTCSPQGSVAGYKVC